MLLHSHFSCCNLAQTHFSLTSWFGSMPRMFSASHLSVWFYDLRNRSRKLYNWTLLKLRPKHSPYAIFHHTCQHLSTQATHGPVRGDHAIGPSLLRVTVASEEENGSGETKAEYICAKYARISESDYVCKIEDKGKHDDRDESAIVWQVRSAHFTGQFAPLTIGWTWARRRKIDQARGPGRRIAQSKRISI